MKPRKSDRQPVPPCPGVPLEATGWDRNPRFYCAWLKTDPRDLDDFLFGLPWRTIAEAVHEAHSRIAAGQAIVAFVVRAEGAEREALAQCTEADPRTSAGRIVQAWEALWDRIDPVE